MAEATQPSPSLRKRPWALTFFGLLAAGGLISMPFLAGKPTDAAMPDIVRFLGHFHPVVLHLPIGVFMLLVFQELGAMFARKGRARSAESLFPMFFGAASAILAVIAGFMLYQGHGGDYAGNELAERHLWGGLIFAVAAVVSFIVKAWTIALAANPAWFRVLLFTSVGVMGFTSHDGGSLTHGSDFLTRYAPEPLRTWLGLEPAKPTAPPADETADPVVYAAIVAPIFERRCVQCHTEEKSKGKFRMDTFERLVKGGGEGPGIEPGNAAESNIVIRMDLPDDDDEHMPPEGKPDIEEAELAVVRWWIDSGADPVKRLSEYEIPAGVKDALAGLAAASAAPSMAPSGPDQELRSQVAELSGDFPGAIAFESQQSARITFSALSLRGKLDDADFEKLIPILPQLASLDLSASLVTDKSVALLESATGLRMLRLSETGVTDSALDTLSKLPALESINLYGTKVTDTGVLKLVSMPNLKRLYLWQTAVTPEAVKTLEEKLPDCEVIAGALSAGEG